MISFCPLWRKTSETDSQVCRNSDTNEGLRSNGESFSNCGKFLHPFTQNKRKTTMIWKVSREVIFLNRSHDSDYFYSSTTLHIKKLRQIGGISSSQIAYGALHSRGLTLLILMKGFLRSIGTKASRNYRVWIVRLRTQFFTDSAYELNFSLVAYFNHLFFSTISLKRNQTKTIESGVECCVIWEWRGQLR